MGANAHWAWGRDIPSLAFMPRRDTISHHYYLAQ